MKERQRKDSTNKVVVATKFAALPWRLGKRTVVSAVRSPLKKLGFDCIDLYQVQWFGRISTNNRPSVGRVIVFLSPKLVLGAKVWQSL